MPLVEIRSLERDDAIAAKVALETWLTELDQLSAAVADSISTEASDGLLDTRIAIRQALELIDQDVGATSAITNIFR